MSRWQQESVIDLVRDLFRGWVGAVAFETAMSAFPDVDVFLAGGAVRDALGGREVKPKDFDIFLGGDRSPEFEACLSEFGEICYGPFGSPRWFPAGGEPYADVIHIARFDNGVERCSNIVDALRQFDFTANAVALNLRTFAFHDPCGGVADYRQGVLRAVRLDYPDEPIAPGHALTRTVVLWMRLMHYSAKLELRPDDSTQAWLTSRKGYAQYRELFATTFFDPLLRTQSLAPA